MTIATDQRAPAVTPGPPPLGLPRPVPVARDPSGDDGRAATTFNVNCTEEGVRSDPACKDAFAGSAEESSSKPTVVSNLVPRSSAIGS